MKKKTKIAFSLAPMSKRSLGQIYSLKRAEKRNRVLESLLMAELEMKACGYVSPPAQTGARDET